MTETTRTVTKNLIIQEDMSYGEGTESQIRNGTAYTVKQIRTIMPVNSLAELNALDTTKFKKAMLFVNGTATFYYFDSGMWKVDKNETRTVDTTADLAALTASDKDIVFVRGFTTVGQKAAVYMAKVGYLIKNEPPEQFLSATAGTYFQRLGDVVDFTESLNQPELNRAYTANTGAINYDKNVWLFGDSHSWGQGAPEWDNYSNALDSSVHSASLFNKGFMARLEEYIATKRGYNSKLHTLAAPVAGMRLLPSDSAIGKADYLANTIKVLTGRVVSASNVYAAGSLKGWYTPDANAEPTIKALYRDKISKGRFDTTAFRIYPSTVNDFTEAGLTDYITLLALPGVAVTGGYTAVTDNNGNVLAEQNGVNFYLRVNDKTPTAEMGFFGSYPQDIFIPGYGKAVATAQVGVAGGKGIQLKAADGVSFPTGLDKWIYVNMKIFKDVYAEKTTVVATPEKAFRKLYIGVYTHPAGRKIEIFLANNTALGGAQWNPNGHLSGATVPSLRPNYNWGQTGYPTIRVINAGGSRVTTVSATTAAVDGGTAVVIDSYGAVAADVVYEIDFGSKVHSDVFIRDNGVASGGTSLYTTVRGLLFDNNEVTNWAMGGHTIGNWLGIGASFSAETRDHMADILAYSKSNPYLVITQLPLVNEYLRQTPLADFRANINTFIQRINDNLNPAAPARAVSFIFFTTIGHRDGEFEGTVYPAISYQDYSDAARDQCNIKDVVFIDARQYIKDKVWSGQIDYKLLYSDNTHPSGVANEMIFTCIANVVDAAL